MVKIKKRALAILLVIGMGILLLPLAAFASGGPTLEIRNYNRVSGNEFHFTDPEGTVIGKVMVKQSGTYQTAASQIQLNDYPEGDDFEQVSLELIPAEGYEVGGTAMIGGTQQQLPGAEENGTRIWNIDVTKSLGSVIIVDGITFQAIGSGGNPGDPSNPPPFAIYDIVAKFQGAGSVVSDMNSTVLLPEGWSAGRVEFYARTCTVDGALVPYYDGMECDEGSYQELRLDIEGITNRDKINRSVGVEGTDGSEVAVFASDFADYGRTGIHLMRPGTEINQLLTVATENLIFVRAEAPLQMSYSLGSATIDNVILTNRQSGSVSIFFGNTETTLRAEGARVTGISNVTGGKSAVYHEDGTVTVILPPLSEETTTTLTLTILLQGGATVAKTVNVARTAIDLGFNTADGNATLEAGYVCNKAYLYQNQNHNDAIFNAYLQVILYKDGVVAGYRQIKIDDEAIINSLRDNESGSMELLSDDRIKLYGKDLGDSIEGVNSASVFLTNGPVDFNSETLPSVEFGIGSGVTITFGGGQNG